MIQTAVLVVIMMAGRRPRGKNFIASTSACVGLGWVVAAGQWNIPLRSWMRETIYCSRALNFLGPCFCFGQFWTWIKDMTSVCQNFVKQKLRQPQQCWTSWKAIFYVEHIRSPYDCILISATYLPHIVPYGRIYEAHMTEFQCWLQTVCPTYIWFNMVGYMKPIWIYCPIGVTCPK